MRIHNKTIIADDGMILTNGTTYATKVRLGDWDNIDNYHEITKEEYNDIIAAEEIESGAI